MKKRFVYLVVLPVLLSGLPAHAAAYFAQQLLVIPLEIPLDSSLIMLAADQEETRIQSQPETPVLLVPAATEENREERMCMTVCSSWGQECVLISHAEGVVSKKCRRACKSFSEECL